MKSYFQAHSWIGKCFLIELPVPPKYSESSVMIEVDQVLPAPVVGPSTAAYAAGGAVLLV
jgi:hypothetical protein